MPASKSDRAHSRPPRIGRDDEAVSEVVGFLLTFAIIATVLVVAMLGFSDAQSRAERRVADIQADSIAQRVAGVMVEAALFLEKQDCTAPGCNDAALSLLLELPPTLQGHAYQVRIVPGTCAGTGPPVVAPTGAFVRVTSGVTRDKDQSLFEAARSPIPCQAPDARPILCDPDPNRSPLQPGATNGGNLYVVYTGSCLGLQNAPVTP